MHGNLGLENDGTLAPLRCFRTAPCNSRAQCDSNTKSVASDSFGMGHLEHLVLPKIFKGRDGRIKPVSRVNPVQVHP